ncbi:uncharacterized protein LOC62_03G003941 [Vanrija pseudolonga]|uniref:Uncharacterized protein n=1 Tax=Vanrija pseudolonga TaxID=143232 RepID=A0AAF0YB68_9TREE|nr:hypothetical protein LOC62_03G003941 [Vanrija pseudolonga]
MDMEVRLTFPPAPAGEPNPLAALRAFAREVDGVRVVAGRKEVRVSLDWGGKDHEESDAAFDAFLACLAPPVSFSLSFPSHSAATRHLFRRPPLGGLRTAALRTLTVQDILEVPSAWELLASSGVTTARTSLCGFTDGDYAQTAARLAANTTLTTFCVDPGCSVLRSCQCWSWVRVSRSAEEGEEGVHALGSLLARNRRLRLRCHAAFAQALLPARVLLLAAASPIAETQRYREVVRAAKVRLASRSRSRSRRRGPLLRVATTTHTPHLSPEWSPTPPARQPPATTTFLSLPPEVVHLILQYVSDDPMALSPAQWGRLFEHAADRSSLAQLATAANTTNAIAAANRPSFARLMSRWLDTGGFVWEQGIPR